MDEVPQSTSLVKKQSSALQDGSNKVLEAQLCCVLRGATEFALRGEGRRRTETRWRRQVPRSDVGEQEQLL